MKDASIRDYWRHVTEKAYPNSLKKFEYEGLLGLSDVQVHVTGGINAICGPNGAGKSTVLSVLGAALRAERGKDSDILLQKTTSGSLSCECSLRGGSATLAFSGSTCTPKQAPDKLYCYLLDTATQAPTLLHYYRTIENLEEMLEAVDEREFKKKELADVSYIVGRRYRAAQVYEIEGADGQAAS